MAHENVWDKNKNSSLTVGDVHLRFKMLSTMAMGPRCYKLIYRSLSIPISAHLLHYEIFRARYTRYQFHSKY